MTHPCSERCLHRPVPPMAENRQAEYWNGGIRRHSSWKTSRIEMAGDAEMSTNDLDEVRVAFGRPDRSHVADEPKQEAREPEAQTNAEGRCERAVENRDGARGTTHQDRLGQRAMDGRLNAWD